MRGRQSGEVVVLSHDGKAMGNGRGRDKGISESDGAVYPSATATDDEPCPFTHHRLADGNGVGLSGQRESVGTSGSDVWLAARTHTQLELTDGDHRHGDPLGQGAESATRLSSNEDRSV